MIINQSILLVKTLQYSSNLGRTLSIPGGGQEQVSQDDTGVGDSEWEEQPKWKE